MFVPELVRSVPRLVRSRALAVALGAAIALGCAGRTAAAESVALDPAHWEISAKEGRFVEHLGRPALRLQGGSALLRETTARDGVLEFDIALTPERGFAGAVWRLQDPLNYENFYLRPHQSGNPDANQYQPVFHGVAAWQLLHGEGYGAPTRYAFDRWMKVRIVFSGDAAEFYVDDLETPTMTSRLQREIASGRVGFEVNDFAPAHFSNVRFTAADDSPPRLRRRPREPAPLPAGAVTSWQVSDAFAATALAGAPRLPDELVRARHWTALAAEPSGTANLARVQGVAENRETVFARVVIRAASAGVKRLRFGFSDVVRVYLDGRLLYAGNDGYRTRDYRFLGTIGLHDEVWLPLVAGENELLLAVSEGFGGWGVQARFDDLDGIALVTPP